MANKERFTTPEGRFAFLSIFEKKDWGDDDNEPKFEATLLLDAKSPALAKFIKQAAVEKFGEKLPAKLKSPVKEGNDCTNGDGEVYDGHDDKVVIKASSLYNLKQIAVKEGDKLRHAETDEIKSGDYGQLILGAGGYEHKGSKGVSLYLISVCKTKDGDPLGGGGATSEEDVFGEIEDSDDMFS